MLIFVVSNLVTVGLFVPPGAQYSSHPGRGYCSAKSFVIIVALSPQYLLFLLMSFSWLMLLEVCKTSLFLLADIPLLIACIHRVSCWSIT